MGENTVSDAEMADFRVLDVDELPAKGMVYKELTITPAQMLAINAAPVVLAAAQADKINEFISAVLILDYESAAYANNGILAVYETDATGTLVSSPVLLADFLAKTADTVQFVPPVVADTPLLPNKALVLTMPTGESITGDSPVRVKCMYRVHDADLA